MHQYYNANILALLHSTFAVYIGCYTEIITIVSQHVYCDILNCKKGNTLPWSPICPINTWNNINNYGLYICYSIF